MTATLKAMARCFQVELADNVATMLEDCAPGELTVLGAGPRTIIALVPIRLGHKVALSLIPAGAPIIKYGVPIGLATSEIQPGSWVHLHNCRSRVDERSSHLDVKTGVARDTIYG